MPHYQPKSNSNFSSGKTQSANDSSQDLIRPGRRWFRLLFPHEIKHDTRLPNQFMRTIEIDGHEPFPGRWLCQYFDRAAGIRYSLGENPDHQFFVLRLDDSSRAVTLQQFGTWQAVCESELPEQLKHPMDLIL